MHTIVVDLSVFAEDYQGARQLFLGAAAQAKGDVTSFAHPLTGPHGEPLFCDIFYQGDPDASAVLVTISATHGIEGFCGSGVQVHCLRHGANQSPNVGLLHIHAINPYGFAWLRRVNEDNVDLNRNFIDFSQPLPDNPGYTELAPHLLPKDLSSTTLLRANQALELYRQTHGERAYEIAVSGGQYFHPKGLFYGGVEKSWSRKLIEKIVGDLDLARRERVAIIDFHTGLGPYGYGELICDHPPRSPNTAYVKRWYGPSVTQPALSTSTSVPKWGLSDIGWQDLLGEHAGFVAAEFGTYSTAQLFSVLQQDHWLHNHTSGAWQLPEIQQIKHAMKQHFYPQRSDWKELVIFRGTQIINQAIDGLAEEFS